MIGKYNQKSPGNMLNDAKRKTPDIHFSTPYRCGICGFGRSNRLHTAKCGIENKRRMLAAKNNEVLK